MTLALRVQNMYVLYRDNRKRKSKALYYSRAPNPEPNEAFAEADKMLQLGFEDQLDAIAKAGFRDGVGSFRI